MELQNRAHTGEGPGFDRESELRLPALAPREALFSFLAENHRFHFPNGPELQDGKLSEKDLKALAQLIDRKFWQPDTDGLIRALRAHELIDLMLMLKTHEFRDQIAQAFVKFSGLASELFQKAMKIAPDELHPRKPDRSWRMKCYSLFAKMLEPFPDQVTTEILQRNLKQPDSNPEQTLRGYKSHWYFLRESISCEGYGEFYARADYESLHPFRMVTSDHMYGSIYMDAPVGLVLSYRQVPQAIVSFMPDPQDPESLSIRQLQGILPLRPEATLGRSARYSIRGLPRLNWENALIEFAEYVARETRFKSTQIVGSGNIKWAAPNYMKMSLERARERYDQTAERMGYSLNPDSKNFTKTCS